MTTSRRWGKELIFAFDMIQSICWFQKNGDSEECMNQIAWNFGEQYSMLGSTKP